jgi:hypothetical protein
MTEQEREDFVLETLKRTADALEAIQRLLYQMVELQKEAAGLNP